MAGWKGKAPIGFHRFVSARLEMTPKELMKDAKRKWGRKFPTNFNVDEKYAMNYIVQTLEAYQMNKYGKLM